METGVNRTASDRRTPAALDFASELLLDSIYRWDRRDRVGTGTYLPGTVQKAIQEISALEMKPTTGVAFARRAADRLRDYVQNCVMFMSREQNKYSAQRCIPCRLFLFRQGAPKVHGICEYCPIRMRTRWTEYHEGAVHDGILGRMTTGSHLRGCLKPLGRHLPVWRTGFMKLFGRPVPRLWGSYRAWGVVLRCCTSRSI